MMTPAVERNRDRPGWIPAHITSDWDISPYAYLTEAEQMSAGGPHNQLLAYIMELLRWFLAQRGLMLLMDVFLLYRDDSGRKQRIAPDLMLIPLHQTPPSAYDLDAAAPPALVVEVTSPSSRLSDLHKKAHLYDKLGINCYLVIDAVTTRDTYRKQFHLYLWRREDGALEIVTPDEQDGFALPELGVHIVVQNQQVAFTDLVTGESIRDTTRWEADLSAEREALLAEREARLQAEAELARLRALLATQNGEG